MLKRVLLSLFIFPIAAVGQKVLDQSFYENGELMMEKVLSGNSDTIYMKVYHRNGNLNQVVPLWKENRAGTVLTYNERGIMIFSENYAGGKLNGVSKSYQSNGNIGWIKHFKTGMEVDRSIFFNEKGDTVRSELYSIPCQFGSPECNYTVTIYGQNKRIYTYQIEKGLKSNSHQILNKRLYEIQMAEERDTPSLEKGKKQFNINCAACHRLDKPIIGPSLGCMTGEIKANKIFEMLNNGDGHNRIKLTQRDFDDLVLYTENNCK